MSRDLAEIMECEMYSFAGRNRHNGIRFVVYKIVFIKEWDLTTDLHKREIAFQSTELHLKIVYYGKSCERRNIWPLSRKVNCMGKN